MSGAGVTWFGRVPLGPDEREAVEAVLDGEPVAERLDGDAVRRLALAGILVPAS